MCDGAVGREGGAGGRGKGREVGREGGHIQTLTYLGSRGDLDATLALLADLGTGLKRARIPARELARAGADLLHLGLAEPLDS